jgi:hypothetical protein
MVFCAMQPVRVTGLPEPPPGPPAVDLIRLVLELREQESRLCTVTPQVFATS